MDSLNSRLNGRGTVLLCVSFFSLIFFTCLPLSLGAQSVECATPDEFPGSISAVAARSLLVGSGCQYNVTG